MDDPADTPSPAKLLAAETGTVRKAWQGRVRIALVYPHQYAVGMANLGFQSVYKLINDDPDALCERVFLPPVNHRPAAWRPASLESGRRLDAFDLVAFSLSFENDYPNVLTILERAGLPLRATDRDADGPPIAAGGVATFLNPEPLAPFIDLFLVGEAEAIVPALLAHLPPDRPRSRWLRAVARDVPGAYVPREYTPEYGAGGLLTGYRRRADVPERVARARVGDLSGAPDGSSLTTPHTTFEAPYLIEVTRGCPHGCRFCSAGYVYRPPRYRDLDRIAAGLDRGAAAGDRVGLVGAAVSDHPDLEAICRLADARGLKLAFSSLRADALTPVLVDALAHSRIRTATLAPEAGSQRLRDVINKHIDEARILEAADKLVTGGVPNLKLYFMVGLPTETEADIDAAADLIRRLKDRFLRASRPRGRMGTITVSVNAFVPKPFTPLQWAAMDDVARLKQKVRRLRDGLRRVANVRLHADNPRWAYLQAVFARGDRRVADLLEAAHRQGGNWTRVLKTSPLNADFYVLRERAADEVFPWEIVDHGLDRAFLRREYRRALGARPSAVCPRTECQACGVCTGLPDGPPGAPPGSGQHRPASLDPAG